MSSESDGDDDFHSGLPANEIPGFYYDRKKRRYFKITPNSGVTNSVSTASLEQRRAERSLKHLNRSLRRLRRFCSKPTSIVQILATRQSDGPKYDPYPDFSTAADLRVSYDGDALNHLLKYMSSESLSYIDGDLIAFLTLRSGRANVSCHRIDESKHRIVLEQRVQASIPHQPELGWGNGVSPLCIIRSPVSSRPLIAFTRMASVETGCSKIYTVQETDDGLGNVQTLEVGVQRRLQTLRFDRRTPDRVFLGGGSFLILYDLVTKRVVFDRPLPHRSFINSLDCTEPVSSNHCLTSKEKRTDEQNVVFTAASNGDLYRVDMRESWRLTSCPYRKEGERKINLLSVSRIPHDESLLLHTFDGKILLYDVRMRRQLHSVTSWCRDYIIKSGLKLDEGRRFAAQASRSGVVTIFNTSSLQPVDVININANDSHSFTELDFQSNKSFLCELTSHVRPRLLIFNKICTNSPKLNVRAC